tara:strand:+ start:1657 stop:2151 length:495 start_codon:yes stop_codon:yes gene_type:complete
MADFINTIERALIDQLRTDFTGFTVFGQFPSQVDVTYPCIIVEQIANGQDENFMGQNVTFGSSATEKTGEIYGLGFRFNILVNKESEKSIVPDGGSGTEVYKQRRLLNWAMLNIANTLMDITFDSTKVQVVERRFNGFTDVGYEPELELWGSTATMAISFENYR